MSREDNEIIVERIQLLTNRTDQLFIISPFKICAPDAAVEEGITAKHAVGMAHQAHTTGGMTRSMQHFECQCAKRDRIAFFQENIRFSLHKWCPASIHSCYTLVCVHMNIVGMDCQWYGVDLTHSIDRTDMVDMTVSIDDIFGNEFEFRDALQDAFCLIARVNNDCLQRLRACV